MKSSRWFISLFCLMTGCVWSAASRCPTGLCRSCLCRLSVHALHRCLSCFRCHSLSVAAPSSDLPAFLPVAVPRPLPFTPSPDRSLGSPSSSALSRCPTVPCPSPTSPRLLSGGGSPLLAYPGWACAAQCSTLAMFLFVFAPILWVVYVS